MKALQSGPDNGQEIARVGDDLHYEGTLHGSVGLRYSLEFDNSAFKLDTACHYANPSKAHMPGGDRQVVKCTLTCLKAGTFVVKEIEDFRGEKKVLAEHLIKVKALKDAPMSLKTLTKWVLAVLVVIIVVTMGASAYMLHYALAPDPGRTDTAACFQRQFEEYPETMGWVDSLRMCNALRDTFVSMTSGERHHALFIRQASNKTAFVLHGWRSCSIDVLFLARIYERVLGYNVVVPDFHGHGLSEGDDIQMGWLERNDLICWMRTFPTDTMVVHGVSMGGAAALVLSGEQLPHEVRDIRFVDDCGYTNVWDELEGELKNQFGLPAFPLMYTSDFLCKLCNGWSFKEASALRQVAHARSPILFIHGEKDTFVPTEMAYRLFSAKPDPKELWISKGSEHALSYKDHKDEYIQRVKDFLIIGDGSQ